MDWTLIIGFVVVMALLLLFSFIDQHYSGIVARKDREIQSLHDQLARLRAITDAIEDEEWALDTADMPAHRPSAYTIRYPLDDRRWPKRDGIDPPG